MKCIGGPPPITANFAKVFGRHLMPHRSSRCLLADSRRWNRRAFWEVSDIPISLVLTAPFCGAERRTRPTQTYVLRERSEIKGRPDQGRVIASAAPSRAGAVASPPEMAGAIASFIFGKQLTRDVF